MVAKADRTVVAAEAGIPAAAEDTVPVGDSLAAAGHIPGGVVPEEEDGRHRSFAAEGAVGRSIGAGCSLGWTGRRLGSGCRALEGWHCRGFARLVRRRRSRWRRGAFSGTVGELVVRLVENELERSYPEMRGQVDWRVCLHHFGGFAFVV